MLQKPQYTLKHEQLLRDLKNTIDGLLSTQVANVWSIYGGLNRLHNTLEKIFKHGCRKNEEINGSFYKFIQGLEWLQPNSSCCFFSTDCEYQSHIPTHLKNNKESIWLYRSLENLSLSTKLGWLLSDKNHLNMCYYAHAYLSNEEYAEATLICLKALERNQPTLMSEINPCLFLLQPNAKDIHKIHRRCSSFPDRYYSKNDDEKNFNIKKKLEIQYNLEEFSDVCKRQNKNHENIISKLKPWSSTPNLFLDKMEVIKEIIESKTVPNTPTHIKKNSKQTNSNEPIKKCTFFKHNFDSTLKINKSKTSIVIDNKNIIEHTPPMSNSVTSSITIKEEKFSPKSENKFLIPSPRSVVDYSFTALPGQKDYTRNPKKSFIEDGGKTILPMSTGYFPQPAKGQSLMSFLTSRKFSQTRAELDRENAHFSISEAIIAALEQIKCKQELGDDNMDDSDPEILDLKQRIRMRRKQKILEKQKKVWATIDKTTESSYGSDFTTSECSSSDNIEDIELDEASNLLDQKGLSISMASLYSESDLRRGRGIPDGASDVFSAESVAISLISKFKEKQLPKASELEWLVSEEDAPQALLPLPDSWPVNPDDSDIPSIYLRGTQDWAPPRPQIIFTLHPHNTRKQLMAKQNYRCAGCSMRVAPQYASKYRYCEYLGRYFCTGCHSNQLSLIPARIIQKWDFTRYPVSTFSYRLLEQMYTDPLFKIFDLNKNIHKIAKDLEFCKKYSLGLFYIKDFIFTCKNAKEIQETLKNKIKKSKEELEIYSMEDLMQIKNGEKKSELKFLVDYSIHHITGCQICMGRGHICQICNKNEIIFPWQMRIVSRCDKCGTCYHKTCWKIDEEPCKKCIRICKRRESDISEKSS